MKVFSNAGPLMALGKLGQLELLYRLFGQVGIPTTVYQEVVIRGSQRGYSDALLIEMALQRKQLVVLDVIHDDLPSEMLAVLISFLDSALLACLSIKSKSSCLIWRLRVRPDLALVRYFLS